MQWSIIRIIKRKYAEKTCGGCFSKYNLMEEGRRLPKKLLGEQQPIIERFSIDIF